MNDFGIEGRDLRINLFSVLERMSAEDKDTLLRDLLCEETVITSIVGQLVDGWDDKYSHGYDTVLQKMRLVLIEKIEPLTMKAVTSVLHDLKAAQADQSRMSDWAWKLYHAWPNSEWPRRPELPSWVSVTVSEEDARSAIAKAKVEA